MASGFVAGEAGEALGVQRLDVPVVVGGAARGRSAGCECAARPAPSSPTTERSGEARAEGSTISSLCRLASAPS